jgi:hypothetical protein
MERETPPQHESPEEAEPQDAPPQPGQHDELALGTPEDGVRLLLVEHL